MNKAIESISILKVYFEKGNNDYIDIFIPFIATLIANKQYKAVDPEVICKDFQVEFGLIVPYHPMLSILKRAKTKGLISKNSNGVFVPDFKIISKYDTSNKTLEKASQLNNLVLEYKKFAFDRYGKDISIEDAESTFLAYIKENDRKILFAFSNMSLLPDCDPKKEKTFILNSFIKNLFETDYEQYRFVCHLIAGYIFANCIFYDEPSSYKGSLKHVTVYLDTRLIIRLAGLEGEYRKSCYEDFVNMLALKGANIKIFSHTKDEIVSIISECVRWIGNPKYNPTLASPVLKHFIENNYETDDVEMFVSKIDTILKFKNIEVIDTPDPNIDKQFQIENDKLFKIIRKIYCENNHHYEDYTKDEVLNRDVHSIASIFKLRKFKHPNFIKDCIALFVTTNSSLAKANVEYNKQVNLEYYKIKECTTDVFVGTTLWSESPSKISDFQEKSLIANCISALEPDDNLLKKFCQLLEKNKKDSLLTADQVYFLKSNKLANSILAEKTLNDVDNYTDKLPEEILAEIKSIAKSEVSSELANEVDSHSKTKYALDESQKNNYELLKANRQIIKKLENIARIISKIFYFLIIAGLIPLGLLVIIYQFKPDLISSKNVQTGAWLLCVVLAVLDLFFEFSVRGKLKLLRDLIEKWIIKKLT